MIEIFDSLTHPTINADWLNPRFNQLCDVAALASDMQHHHVVKAMAVGMKGVGGYELEKYIAFLKPYPDLVPIAFCEASYSQYDLEYIKSLGYKGIKIHPRLSGLALDDNIIFKQIDIARKLGFIVLYCSFTGISSKFVNKIDDYPLVLLHSGGKGIEKTIDSLLHRKNILFDLSYTWKYLELQDTIFDLFKNMHDRICIGSDHPELSIADMRGKFNYFSSYIGRKEAECIASKNMNNFLCNFGGTA